MQFKEYKNKKIYFLGIGGISMYAIALFLKNKGAIISGYDRQESETTSFLQKNGIEVYFQPSENNSKGVDYCICTAAIGKGNPEYDNVSKNGIKIIYRGDCLGSIIENFNNSIGVSGTHGKSTTSGMLSEISLADKEKDPTIFMGAVLPSINSAYKIGNKDDIIFEACEYKDSFLSFKPMVSVILNVSLDHTDYFKSFEQMKNSFINFASSSETVVVNYDCKNALECAYKSKKNVVTYSIIDENADFYINNIINVEGKTKFDLFQNGQFLSSIILNVHGKHNISNAVAAASASMICGVSIENIVMGLKNFKGIKRRFELLGTVNGAYIYDDYAHHPDEINATLDAATSLKANRIICIFQPHTYTRLSYFFENFQKIFNKAYKNFGIKTIFLPTYAAREINKYGFDTEKLHEVVEDSAFLYTLEEASEYIIKNAQKGDAYILMGAGDITNISKKLTFDNN